MEGFVAELKKIPPITRFVCGSSLAVTISTMLGAVSPYSVVFVKELAFKKLQLWRLYTCFFLGSKGFPYIFEFIMLYRTMNDLETQSYFLRSADLAWQLLIASGTILVISFPLQPGVLTRPFLVCIVYLASKLAPPNSTTSIMGLVTVPIIYFPYILIAFDFIIGGPYQAALSTAGAMAGHLWWWSVWGGRLASEARYRNLARAPQWMRNLVGETGAPVPPPAAGGAAAGLAKVGIHVTAPANRRGPSGTSVTEHSWGSGQKLGSS